MIRPAPPVRRRHVFFLAGFDPKSARWYHALYRTQARRQTAVSGLALDVGRERSRPSPLSTAWTIDSACSPEAPTRTDYELLQWDDIVRAHWAGSASRVLIDGLRTVSHGLRDGAVQRMYRLFRPPVYATFFPLLVLGVCAALAIGLGSAIAFRLGAAGLLESTPLRLLAGALAAGAAFALGMRLVHQIQISWLLRLVHFAVLQVTGRAAGLDQRLDDFAARIAAVATRVDDPPDEILVVGHSVGATLAISVLARVLGQLPTAAGHAPIALLSLGHCIPLHTSLSQARQLRDELQRVAASDIDWLDITAPIDWAAFPAIDPVSAAGLPAAPDWHPRLQSPRFHKLFSAAGYARLRRNRFQVHMQYLMASEHSGGYDYFAITGGAQRLRDRFATPPAPADARTAAE